MSGHADQLEQVDDNALKKPEAIIRSMTPKERRNPSILNASRRKRIAAGSGTTVQDVNQLINQFEQAKKMMKSFMGRKGKGAHAHSLPVRTSRGIPKKPGFPYTFPKSIQGGISPMSVKIRLKRMGMKKNPFYRVVVADVPQPSRWPLH